MVEIAYTLKDNLRTASPYHRILAFSQLTDRVEKLHNFIARTDPQPALRVEFVDPITGEADYVPFWSKKNEEA